MLYSCTNMATVGVKGLRQHVTVAVTVNGRPNRWLTEPGRITLTLYDCAGGRKSVGGSKQQRFKMSFQRTMAAA